MKTKTPCTHPPSSSSTILATAPDPAKAGEAGSVSTLNSQPPNPQLSSAPPHSLTDSLTHSLSSSPAARRRTGNIARLPKDVRQRVNEMLDDGLPYEEIIEALGEHGQNISDDCVGCWKRGGYQDYLRELRIVEQCRYRQGLAFNLVAKRNPINGFQATQQIAAAQICEAVTVLGPDILRDALVANPLNYFRMLNSFARITTGGLKCDRHLAEQAERTAKTNPRRKKGLSAAALKEMNEKLNLM